MAEAAHSQVAILSDGVWQLRGAVAELTGMEPVRWSSFRRPRFGCVVGWGLKPLARRARKLACRNDAEFIALEDGFIRSVWPGAGSPPLSMIVDRTGIHYDATQTSDLESFITASADNHDGSRIARASAAMQLLRRHAISKYNHAHRLSEQELGLNPNRRRGRVLVVDQTREDCSIRYGNASTASFDTMLDAALDENPGAEIVVKTHPEAISGRKRGHFGPRVDAVARVVGVNVNPWSLIEVVDRVYVVTSQLGFEAALAGKRVDCFGTPFYSGWGVTYDRIPCVRRVARPSLEQLCAAVYFDYSRYICPLTTKETTFESSVCWLIEQRSREISVDAYGWRLMPTPIG